MIRSLWTASTGMSSQQMNMDVISHNLANSNTTGFKQSRANFEDLMYQTIVPPGANAGEDNILPVGVQVGMGAKTASVQKNFVQGNFVETGNKLDLAIEGNGFFTVLRNGEEVYTRAGSFKLDQDGFICDAEGNRLQPEINVPVEATGINVDSGGTVTAMSQNGEILAVDNITLSHFANPAGLSSIGRNYFVSTEASGDAVEGDPGMDGLGSLLQGFLENSNVNVVEEMVNMIVGQRAYEANSKVIKVSDEMLQMANNVKV